MQSENYRNSVFIAYHGSSDAHGTEGIGKQTQEAINRKYPVAKAYCGPNTDERTFDRHMEDVIPYSALFLAVVNDDCPQDESGRLDCVKSKYLYAEIEAFYRLVKKNLRNKKDFAVHYCGNMCKTQEEKMAYVTRLLSGLDPDGLLSVGNQYFVVDRVHLDYWINERLIDVNNTVLTNEKYYPFDLLRKKVEDVMHKSAGGQFVLQMEKGMGKTTFVKSLANDRDFAQTVAVRPVYINHDNDCASLDHFLWDFSDLLRRDDDGNMRRPNSAPGRPLDKDFAQSFVRFVNECKTQMYPERKLLIVLDGIDDIGISGKRNILDFFEDVTFAEGVYILFSCRVFADDETVIENPAYAFVKRFRGERILFKSDSYDYLKFLYDYFNDNIISQFSLGNDPIDVRDIFTSIQPKNILSFSILFKISEIYLNRTPSDKADWRILCSMENALDFYYNYMKQEAAPETFEQYRKLLVIFAFADCSLRSDELREAFGIDFSSETLEKEKYLRIFIKKTGDARSESFGIVHDRLKQLILSDNRGGTRDLIEEIRQKLLEQLRSGMSLEELYVSRFALFKFLPALLDGDALSRETKRELIEAVTALPFAQDWTKSTQVTRAERHLLQTVTNRLAGEASDLAEKHLAKVALMYAVFAQDSYILNYFTESGEQFANSKACYDRLGVAQASDDVKREYAEMLTVYGTYYQLCGNNASALELFKECVALCDGLYARNAIPLDDYVHYRVSMSNIYHTSKNFGMQKKTLDTAAKIGGPDFGEKYRSRYAFMQQAYYAHYVSKKKYKKALAQVEKALAAYKLAYAEEGRAMFVGNMVSCVACKIDMLSKICANDKEACLSEAMKEYDYINGVIEQSGFRNPNIDMRVPEAMARLYCALGMKKEALAACNRLLVQVNAISSIDGRDFTTLASYRDRIGKILSDAQKLA